LNYNFKKDLFYYIKKKYLNFIFRNIIKNKKSILDFSCGSGELSDALVSKKNKKVYASDIFKNKPKTFNKQIKYINNKRIFKNNKKFDCIILRHVLEHEIEFTKLIKKLKNKLNINGIIYIEVPNYLSIWKLLMKERWPGYFYPFHYHLFSNKFLEKKFRNLKYKKITFEYSESPVIGTFLLTFGFNRSFSKLISLITYPFQILVSKLFFRSENLKIICKK